MSSQLLPSDALKAMLQPKSAVPIGMLKPERKQPVRKTDAFRAAGSSTLIPSPIAKPAGASLQQWKPAQHHAAGASTGMSGVTRWDYAVTDQTAPYQALQTTFRQQAPPALRGGHRPLLSDLSSAASGLSAPSTAALTRTPSRRCSSPPAGASGTMLHTLGFLPSSGADQRQWGNGINGAGCYSGPGSRVGSSAPHSRPDSTLTHNHYLRPGSGNNALQQRPQRTLSGRPMLERDRDRPIPLPAWLDPSTLGQVLAANLIDKGRAAAAGASGGEQISHRRRPQNGIGGPVAMTAGGGGTWAQRSDRSRSPSLSSSRHQRARRASSGAVHHHATMSSQAAQFAYASSLQQVQPQPPHEIPGLPPLPSGSASINVLKSMAPAVAGSLYHGAFKLLDTDHDSLLRPGDVPSLFISLQLPFALEATFIDAHAAAAAAAGNVGLDYVSFVRLCLNDAGGRLTSMAAWLVQQGDAIKAAPEYSRTGADGRVGFDGHGKLSGLFRPNQQVQQQQQRQQLQDQAVALAQQHERERQLEWMRSQVQQLVPSSSAASASTTPRGGRRRGADGSWGAFVGDSSDRQVGISSGSGPAARDGGQAAAKRGRRASLQLQAVQLEAAEQQRRSTQSDEGVLGAGFTNKDVLPAGPASVAMGTARLFDDDTAGSAPGYERMASASSEAIGADDGSSAAHRPQPSPTVASSHGRVSTSPYHAAAVQDGSYWPNSRHGISATLTTTTSGLHGTDLDGYGDRLASPLHAAPPHAIDTASRLDVAASGSPRDFNRSGPASASSSAPGTASARPPGSRQGGLRRAITPAAASSQSLRVGFELDDQDRPSSTSRASPRAEAADAVDTYASSSSPDELLQIRVSASQPPPVHLSHAGASPASGADFKGGRAAEFNSSGNDRPGSRFDSLGSLAVAAMIADGDDDKADGEGTIKQNPSLQRHANSAGTFATAASASASVPAPSPRPVDVAVALRHFEATKRLFKVLRRVIRRRLRPAYSQWLSFVLLSVRAQYNTASTVIQRITRGHLARRSVLVMTAVAHAAARRNGITLHALHDGTADEVADPQAMMEQRLKAAAMQRLRDEAVRKIQEWLRWRIKERVEWRTRRSQRQPELAAGQWESADAGSSAPYGGAAYATGDAANTDASVATPPAAPIDFASVVVLAATEQLQQQQTEEQRSHGACEDASDDDADGADRSDDCKRDDGDDDEGYVDNGFAAPASVDGHDRSEGWNNDGTHQGYANTRPAPSSPKQQRLALAGSFLSTGSASRLDANGNLVHEDEHSNVASSVGEYVSRNMRRRDSSGRLLQPRLCDACADRTAARGCYDCKSGSRPLSQTPGDARHRDASPTTAAAGRPVRYCTACFVTLHAPPRLHYHQYSDVRQPPGITGDMLADDAAEELGEPVGCLVPRYSRKGERSPPGRSPRRGDSSSSAGRSTAPVVCSECAQITASRSCYDCGGVSRAGAPTTVPFCTSCFVTIHSRIHGPGTESGRPKDTHQYYLADQPAGVAVDVQLALLVPQDGTSTVAHHGGAVESDPPALSLTRTLDSSARGDDTAATRAFTASLSGGLSHDLPHQQLQPQVFGAFAPGTTPRAEDTEAARQAAAAHAKAGTADVPSFDDDDGLQQNTLRSVSASASELRLRGTISKSVDLLSASISQFDGDDDVSPRGRRLEPSTLQRVAPPPPTAVSTDPAGRDVVVWDDDDAAGVVSRARARGRSPTSRRAIASATAVADAGAGTGLGPVLVSRYNKLRHRELSRSTSRARDIAQQQQWGASARSLSTTSRSASRRPLSRAVLAFDDDAAAVIVAAAIGGGGGLGGSSRGLAPLGARLGPSTLAFVSPPEGQSDDSDDAVAMMHSPLPRLDDDGAGKRAPSQLQTATRTPGARSTSRGRGGADTQPRVIDVRSRRLSDDVGFTGGTGDTAALDGDSNTDTRGHVGDIDWDTDTESEADDDQRNQRERNVEDGGAVDAIDVNAEASDAAAMADHATADTAALDDFGDGQPEQEQELHGDDEAEGGGDEDKDAGDDEAGGGGDDDNTDAGDDDDRSDSGSDGADDEDKGEDDDGAEGRDIGDDAAADAANNNNNSEDDIGGNGSHDGGLGSKEDNDGNASHDGGLGSKEDNDGNASHDGGLGSKEDNDGNDDDEGSGDANGSRSEEGGDEASDADHDDGEDDEDGGQSEGSAGTGGDGTDDADAETQREDGGAGDEAEDAGTDDDDARRDDDADGGGELAPLHTAADAAEAIASAPMEAPVPSPVLQPALVEVDVPSPRSSTTAAAPLSTARIEAASDVGLAATSTIIEHASPVAEQPQQQQQQQLAPNIPAPRRKQQHQRHRGKGAGLVDPDAASPAVYQQPVMMTAAAASQLAAGAGEWADQYSQQQQGQQLQGSPFLPPGWQAVWDETYQAWYYWCKGTGETTWEMPGHTGAAAGASVAGYALIAGGADGGGLSQAVWSPHEAPASAYPPSIYATTAAAGHVVTSTAECASASAVAHLKSASGYDANHPKAAPGRNRLVNIL